jgi:hypothetical protein
MWLSESQNSWLRPNYRHRRLQLRGSANSISQCMLSPILDSWAAKCHHAGETVVSTQTISRLAAGTLFIVGGTCLMLASLLGAASFWYIPCVCALIPLGFV